MGKLPIRLAVVGARRGRALDGALAAMPGRAQLTAICDSNPAAVDAWRQAFPEVATFTSYERMLDESDCDAVFLATPMPLHAAQAVQALDAGRHVLSEVAAATTLEECWALVEAVERSGRVYMMAENYCYMRPNMMVLNLARQGLFGDITYAEGGYIHDCRYLLFNDAGDLTWRGRIHHEWIGNTYPTHSLGPVAQWLGIGRPGGDRLATAATFMARPAAAAIQTARKLGSDHPLANPKAWTHGDSATTILTTEKGAVINLRVDWSSPRPHNATHYALQGTKGAYLSARHGGEDPLVWLEGISKGVSPDVGEPHPEWQSLWSLADRYEHPLWREGAEAAKDAGHGGGDFFVLRDFLNAVEGSAPPTVDVYDAVTWSSIIPLSAESVRRGGEPMPVPDFRRGRAR